MKKKIKDHIDWDNLSKVAWSARKNAIAGSTSVGCAVLSNNGNYYSGCNIEQTYRNKDIHAEVCAISKMVSEGDIGLIAILVVAERERFTPCGTCMDWIFQFGGSLTLVGFQNKQKGDIKIFTAKQLMPFYPK